MRLNMYVACCTALATFGSALYLPTSDFAQVAHHDENYINDLAEAYAESEIMDGKKSIAKEAAKAAKKTVKTDTKDKKADNKGCCCYTCSSCCCTCSSCCPCCSEEG